MLEVLKPFQNTSKKEIVLEIYVKSKGFYETTFKNCFQIIKDIQIKVNFDF